MLNDYVPCFRCSFQTSRLIILNRRALLIDHNDNAKDNTNDGNGDCCESHITSLTSINSRKIKLLYLIMRMIITLRFYVWMSKAVVLTY